ncbi:MAG: DUF4124 domain-containing protein [Ramlibacter sp.]
MLGLTQRAATTAWLLCGSIGAAGAEGIYTCVDAKGRRLTADRPIAECMDREQKELSSGGLLRRKIMPEPTSQERVAEEEKARKLVEERTREADEKKRMQALISRYPSKPSHDKERAAALAKVDEVATSAGKRILELAGQRKQLEAEAEFYKRDPAKMPGKLKRQLEEIDEQAAAQKRFVADQGSEKKRINDRFDEEAVRLKTLWGQAGPAR